MGFRGRDGARESMVTYIPEQGDIILLDFNPIKGREQRGKRPALIISNNDFYKKTGLLMVSPISNTENQFPLHLKLDDRLKVTGSVLTQHIRTIDPQARPIEFLDKISNEFLEKVINLVKLFL